MEANPDPEHVTLLMRHAAGGDSQAWERLVDQFSRLIWSITGEFRLVESDAADVVQTTWLRRLEYIGTARVSGPGRLLAGGHRSE